MVAFSIPMLKTILLPRQRFCGSQAVREQLRRHQSVKAMQESGHAKRTIPEVIEVGGLKIYGVSVAAVETCICIPSLSLAFDAGKAPHGSIAMRHMAITHGHCDHVHGLPLHLATRSLQKLPPATYYVPSEVESDIRNLIEAVGRLEGSTWDANIVPLTPESAPIEFKKNWLLQAFQTDHSVPSLGYIVYKKKKRLKAEYVGHTGSQLAQMRKRGVDLDEVMQVAEIAFTGDTSIDGIAESEACRKAKILITEMTFLDDQCSPGGAHSFGHMHIREISERYDLFQDNEHVIFTHFSARYSAEEISRAMATLPMPLRAKSRALGIRGAVS